MIGGSGATQNIDDIHHESNLRLPLSNTSQSFTAVIQDNTGNPFLEESNDLLVLDTNHIMESVAETVMKVTTISGQDQYRKFALNCCQTV